MPIINASGIMRFADNCGADIPRWIRLRLQSYGDDTASIRAFGLDVVTALVRTPRAGGAPGMHFYTMNQSQATLEICRRLGAPEPRGIAQDGGGPCHITPSSVSIASSCRSPGRARSIGRKPWRVADADRHRARCSAPRVRAKKPPP